MRPSSIGWFERLIFGALFLGIVQSYLGWDQALATAEQAGFGAGFVLSIQAFSLAMIAVLTLLISRRRSKIAMWISIGFFVLGLPGFIALLSSGSIPGSGWISIIHIVMQLVAYGLLFTPASRAWMNYREPPTEVFS